MSLRQAVENVVEEMEAERKDLEPAPAAVLRYYLGQLRAALKASEGEEAIRPATPAVDPLLLAQFGGGTKVGPSGMDLHFIEQERLKIRQARGQAAEGAPALRDKQLLDAGDFGGLGAGEKLVPLADGPEVDEGGAMSLLVPADIRVGQRPEIAGALYEYRDDGRLHYLPDATKAMREQQIAERAAQKAGESPNGIILGSA